MSASLYGPDTAFHNALNYMLAESSVLVREALFRKMLTLLNLLGAKVDLSLWFQYSRGVFCLGEGEGWCSVENGGTVVHRDVRSIIGGIFSTLLLADAFCHL